MPHRPPRVRRSSAGRVLAKVLLLAGFGALTPTVGWADYCEGRVESALSALVDQSPTPIGPAEQENMQAVLMGLCADAVQAGGGTPPPAAPVALVRPPAEDGEADEEGVTILGIQFQKADPDSAGNERLRTKR